MNLFQPSSTDPVNNTVQGGLKFRDWQDHFYAVWVGHCCRGDVISAVQCKQHFIVQNTTRCFTVCPLTQDSGINIGCLAFSFRVWEDRFHSPPPSRFLLFITLFFEVFRRYPRVIHLSFQISTFTLFHWQGSKVPSVQTLDKINSCLELSLWFPHLFRRSSDLSKFDILPLFSLFKSLSLQSLQCLWAPTYITDSSLKPAAWGLSNVILENVGNH